MLPAATNLTMSTCEVPQASQADVSPILAGILGMLALMIVIVRVIQRTVFRQNFGWDDGLIVGALVCAAPLNCLMFPSKYEAPPKGYVGLTPGSCSAKRRAWNQHLDDSIRPHHPAAAGKRPSPEHRTYPDQRLCFSTCTSPRPAIWQPRASRNSPSSRSTCGSSRFKSFSGSHIPSWSYPHASAYPTPS